MTDEGRRAHERFAIEIPVVFVHDGQEVQGQTVNVSLGGMFLRLATDVPYGAKGVLRIHLPALDVPTEVEATVRWTTAEGIGVQFGSLRAREVWALNQLFKT